MADAVESEHVGTYESRQDAGKSDKEVVRMWMRAIDMACAEERPWHEKVKKTVERYRHEERRITGQNPADFNILYSQVETLRTSIYNSEPIPSVRRRFDRDDPVAKIATRIAQSVLQVSMDTYDFDQVLADAAFDMALKGRCVTRINLMLKEAGDGAAYKAVETQPVPYDDFCHGPARRWQTVPWIAFRQRMTRDELVDRFGSIGRKVKLDWIDGAKSDSDGDVPPDIFGRAIVWQIWDKEKRQVIHIAPQYKEKPLDITDDPYQLKDFFPIPRPRYDVFDSESLIPVVPYEQWRTQAEELDKVTMRISRLTDALRARGIYAGTLSEIDDLKLAQDGELVPAQSATAIVSSGADLGKAVWMWPIETLIAVLRELLMIRDQIKQTIFEITGISDIMRGQSNASETLGAQQMKAEFGSLRLRDRQASIQNYAAELLRMKLEVILELFEPDFIRLMTSIERPEQRPDGSIDDKGGEAVDDELLALALDRLKNDVVREFTVDVETNSTIARDLQHIRAENAEFTQALGTFFQGAFAYVESGNMPEEIFVDLTNALAQPYQLSHRAQDALDRWREMAKKAAAEPKEEPPNPEIVKLQQEQQFKAQELQMKQAEMQGKMQLAAQEQERKAREAEAQLALAQQTAQLQAGQKQADMQAKYQLEAVKLDMQRRMDEQHQAQQREIEALKAMVQDRASARTAEVQRYSADKKATTNAAKQST